MIKNILCKTVELQNLLDKRLWATNKKSQIKHFFSFLSELSPGEGCLGQGEQLKCSTCLWATCKKLSDLSPCSRQNVIQNKNLCFILIKHPTGVLIYQHLE